MSLTSEPYFVKESSWCLANITAGDSMFVRQIVSSNFFVYLENALKSHYDVIYEQAVWIVGNISADSMDYRVEMRRLKFPSLISAWINSHDVAKSDLMKYSN